MFQKKSMFSLITRAIWGSILQIAIGCLLLFFPDIGTTAVAAVVAWGLLIIGFLCLLLCIISLPFFLFTPALVGVIGILLGIHIIKDPTALMQLFSILAGIYLITQGLGTLLDSWQVRKSGGHFVLLVLGLIMLGAGIAVLCFPLAASRAVVRVFGSIMLLLGIGRMIFRFVLIGKMRKAANRIFGDGDVFIDPNIIDADE